MLLLRYSFTVRSGAGDAWPRSRCWRPDGGICFGEVAGPVEPVQVGSGTEVAVGATRATVTPTPTTTSPGDLTPRDQLTISSLVGLPSHDGHAGQLGSAVRSPAITRIAAPPTSQLLAESANDQVGSLPRTRKKMVSRLTV